MATGAWTQVTALERGIEGWVRNRRDGTVEALFAGPEETCGDDRDCRRRSAGRPRRVGRSERGRPRRSSALRRTR